MNYRIAAVCGTMMVMTLVMVLTLGGSMTTPLAAQSASPPTFNKDVASIIFDNCVRCHRPNQVAPMSLMSYKEIRPWARAIKNKVVTRDMPPWFADPRFGEFSNDPRLSEAQIKTVVDWVDAGAPEGNTPLAAALPKSNDGWTHPSGREPDIVIEAPPFNAPAQGEVPWFNVYAELPDSIKGKEIFVEALQILPGEVAGMHHAGFRMRAKPAGTRIGEGEAWPGGIVIPGALLDAKTGRPIVLAGADEGVGGGGAFRPESDDPEVAAFDFCCYVPGGTFASFGDGGYLRIPPYKDGMIFWSMHYTMIGRPFTDKTRVGIWIQKNPKVEIEVGSGAGPRSEIVLGRQLIKDDSAASASGGGPELPRIPANMADYSITSIQAYMQDVTLYTVWPHMHLHGHEMTYVLTYPDGRERILFSNLNYNYNWQLFYNLKEPVKIPAGSTLKLVGSMDNSKRNKFNPAPDKEKFWSEQNWDEMYTGFRHTSIDNPSGTK